MNYTLIAKFVCYRYCFKEYLFICNLEGPTFRLSLKSVVPFPWMTMTQQKNAASEPRSRQTGNGGARARLRLIRYGEYILTERSFRAKI